VIDMAHGPQWFKFAASFFSNRKIVLAGRDGRDIFLAVLCLNALRGSHGCIPIADWDAEYLAHVVGISVTEAVTGMAKAESARLVEINDASVEIVGWDEHWSSRPKTRAEIQKAYRERNKNRDAEALPSYRAKSNASNELPIDREIDRERGASNAPGSLSASPSEKPQKTRAQTGAAQPLSSAWEPSASAAAYAHSQGLDTAEEARRFRLNAAQRGHTFADADAAFELWLSRSHDKGKRRPPKPGAYTTKQQDDVVFTDAGPVRSEQSTNSGELQQGSQGSQGSHDSQCRKAKS
jgi:hypothetical protein